MDVIWLKEVDEETRRLISELLNAYGPPPIDVVVVGAERTRLEVGDLSRLDISLPLDKYAVLREVALSHAVADPQLIEIWAIPPDVRQDELAAELSLALLLRLVDSMVAKVDFELLMARASPGVIEGDTVAYTIVRTFANDVSISLALASRLSEALQIVNRLAQHPVYQLYRQFWDFALTNFKFLPLYNWLLLL